MKRVLLWGTALAAVALLLLFGRELLPWLHVSAQKDQVTRIAGETAGEPHFSGLDNLEAAVDTPPNYTQGVQALDGAG